MNIIRTGRNITLIALLLSLLFHGSTILYIFCQKTNKLLFPSENKTDLDIQNKNKQQQKLDVQKKDEWAETRARAGEFGAPVFFKDDPEEIEIDEPTPEQDLIMQQESVTPIEEPIQEEKIEHPVSEVTQQLPKDIDATATIAAAEIIPKPEPKIIPKRSAPKRKAQPRKKTQLTTQATAHNVPKPPITLAQLAQGFLEQRKELAGNYGISMLGMKQGMPSDEQMKYERYLQKLSWCIQNSISIHRDKQPPLTEQPIVRIFFSLDRDGSLKQLYIKKSSGNLYVDQFILFIFRDASSSFPPIPKYLTDDPFSMMCTFC
jgi:outer membrane biosynthesis protein TonB